MMMTNTKSILSACLLVFALVQQPQTADGFSFKLIVASITKGDAGSDCVEMKNAKTTFYSGTGCQDLPQPEGQKLSVKSVLFGCGSENSTITWFSETGCPPETEVETWTSTSSMLMCRYNLDGAVEVKCGLRFDGTSAPGVPDNHPTPSPSIELPPTNSPSEFAGNTTATPSSVTDDTLSPTSSVGIPSTASPTSSVGIPSTASPTSSVGIPNTASPTSSASYKSATYLTAMTIALASWIAAF